MLDIGVGYYSINTTDNVIDAIWYTSRMEKKEAGTGIAKGDTSNGFPGNYIVTYFDPDGSESGTFDLQINKSGPVYDLSYSKNDELVFIGVGIETPDGMAIGYRQYE